MQKSEGNYIFEVALNSFLSFVEYKLNYCRCTLMNTFIQKKAMNKLSENHSFKGNPVWHCIYYRVLPTKTFMNENYVI